MKQLFFGLAFLLFAISSIEAQETENTYNMGVTGGVNFSNLYGSDADGAKNRTGFNLGFIYEPFLSDKFSIEAGVFYSQQGATFDDVISGCLKYNYVNFPILPKYYFSDKFSLALGPYFGFNVGSKIYYDQEVNGENSYDDERVNGFDLGLKMKLQYNISDSFFISGGYSIGFLKVYKEINIYDPVDGTTTIESPKIYNNFFHINLGYNFK